MITETDIQRLNHLSQRLEDILKTLRIDSYNAPINRDVEKRRLQESYEVGKVYNPQFEYRIVPDGISIPLQQILRELEPERNAWEYLLFKETKNKLDTLESVTTHDPAQITASSIAADGLLTDKLVEQAYSGLSQDVIVSEDANVTSEVAAQIMREALDSVGLHDWEIIVEEVMNAAMSVRSVEKQVKIRKDKLFTPHAIKRLLVHEIGTHVFRYTNGASQQIYLLRLGLAGYMMTEEGMATYHEQKYDLRDPITSRRYALRVIAAHLSFSHSYFDVFDQIVKHTSFDDAFDIVTRAKRGFTDTSQFGVHIKDKVYFEGFAKVSDHLNANPGDYQLLMGGKVSLDTIPLLKQLVEVGLFVLPVHLPEMIKLSN